MAVIDNETKKLTVRDLVTCGIFTALFFVFFMIGGIFFAPNPVLTFLMPAAVALLTGPVYLLLVAKVPKHGPIIILGVILGLLVFVTGMYWLWAVALIVFAVIADLIAGTKKFKSMNMNILSFVVLSLNPLGSYMMLWINRKGYFEYLTGKGTTQEYVSTMGATAQWWMLPAMILSIVLCAWVSALIGKRLMRKQFEKAGITA